MLTFTSVSSNTCFTFSHVPLMLIGTREGEEEGVTSPESGIDSAATVQDNLSSSSEGELSLKE